MELVGWWAPVISWMAFILVASGDYFSFTQTGSWLSFLLGLVSDVPADRFGAVHLIVRKTAHLVEYGLLGFLAYRAFHCTWRDWPADRWWVGSLALALACATTDELYQSTVPSRTGSFWDVLVDAAGASLGVYLFCRFIAPTNGREAAESESVALDSELDA
jgi:VanZ family protein